MIQAPGDDHFMRLAIQEAEAAFEADEVPVGAVIVCKGQVIARGHNLTERLHDFTAHAEMQAYTSASEYLGGKYLDQCTLYVTLEPCVMCAGGAFLTRINRLVFGAYDPKRGFTSVAPDSQILHPKTTITAGLMAEECSILLKDFFKKRRMSL